MDVIEALKAQMYEPLTDQERAQLPPFTDDQAALAARALDQITAERVRAAALESAHPDVPPNSSVT
jgi:hypothetical protein